MKRAKLVYILIFLVVSLFWLGNTAIAYIPSPHGNYVTNQTEKCANCHVTHNGEQQNLNIKTSEYGLCMICHDGVSGPIASNFPSTSQHLWDAKKSYCSGCHNPHKSQTDPIPHLLRDKYSTQTKTGVPGDYQLCFDCHQATAKTGPGFVQSSYDIYQFYSKSSNLGAGTYGTDKGHFIKSPTGTYKFADGTAVNQDYQLSCSDCHDKHGSKNKKMLKEKVGDNPNVITLTDASSSNLTVAEERSFCQGCHNGTTHLYNSTDVNAILWNPQSVKGHTDTTKKCTLCHGSSGTSDQKAMHGAHAPTNGVSNGGQDCADCHDNITSASSSANNGTFHHVSNQYTFDNTKYISNKSCFQCHLDHDKFNPGPAGNLKGSNLRTIFDAITGTAVPVDTDFLNSAYDPGYTKKGGLCLSCHLSQQTKNYDNTKQVPVLPQPAVYESSAHNYTANSTFKDNSTFKANCAKCHNDTMTKEKQTSTNKFSTHSSTFSSILTPFGDATLTDPMNEKFCYKCHGTNNPNYSAGKDYYGLIMSTNALGIQAKFTTTTDLSIPSSHNLTQMRCASCHNTHNVSKRDGTGKAQTATTSVYSDPSNTLNPFTSASGDEVAFCLKCHTSGTKPTATNTATTYVPMTITFTDPSPNGFTNNGSGWYKDIYTNSTHYNNPIKKTFCNDCHDSHGSTNPLLRKYSDDTATTDGDCFVCHNGSIVGVPNIKGEFLKSDSHPSLSATTGSHSVTENYNLLGTSSRHAKCEDCHDPHAINDGKTTLTAATATGATSFIVTDGTQFPNKNGAVIMVGAGTANAELAVISSVSANTVNVSPGLTKTHTSGNTVSIAAPTRPGMLRNSSGVGVGTRTAWASLPSNSTTYTFKKSVDNEYELCYKCHSTYSWGTTPPTASSGGLETDVPQQFNPANASYHPVEAATKNSWSYITGENFNTASPFRVANTGKQKMYCMDCHGDDKQQADGYTPVVRGPHGSANKYLLSQPYNAGPNLAAKNNLCLVCHSAAVYDSNNSASAYANYTGFRNSSGNLHLEHRNAYYPSYFGGSGDWFCGDCHGLYVHGQQRPHLIVYQTDPAPYNTWSALTSFTNPNPGSYSETSCLVGANPRTGAKCYSGH